MGALVDDQRLPLDQAGTHAVGPLDRLAPDGAGSDTHIGRGVGEAGIADIVQQDPVAVRQYDGVARARELLVEIRHLRPRDLEQVTDALLTVAKVGSRDDQGVGRRAPGRGRARPGIVART